jgi:homopolymeric O-antigen transport system ATP-binding protein
VSEPLLVVENIGKRYRLTLRAASTTVTDAARDGLARLKRRLSARDSDTDQEFWALRNVSFELQRGDVLGVIGPNGAGKSTLLKILARITEPSEGYASIQGRVGSLLEVGTGFHPELSGRDNVYLNGALLGMRHREIASKFDEIVEFSGIGRFIDVPVKRYSSGMHVRLAFAVAAHLEPEILLIDEVLAVGDQAFQQKCLGRIDEIAHGGRTILYVSHNLASVSALCTQACLLDRGGVVHYGAVDQALKHYHASFAARERTTLGARTDRKGDGRLKCTQIEVVGENGPVRTGDAAEIRIHYEAESELLNVMAGVSINGILGQPLGLCATKYTGQDLERIPRRGLLVCGIPRLPLVPDRYSLNVYVEVNGLIADWVQDAHTFDVAESDFFGSGQLPPRTHGPYVFDHSWSLAQEELVGADTSAASGSGQ